MRLRTASCIAALATAPFVVFAAATPASGGPPPPDPPHPLEVICGMSPHPGDADGAVAAFQGQFVGEEVWNVTAEDQEIAAAILPGSAAKVEVRFFNDDDVTHDIVLRGDFDLEVPPPGVVIKVTRESNGKDVTNKVFSLAGLRFRGIETGDFTGDLVVRVKIQPNASPDAVVNAFISGNYETASACGDTIGVLASSNPTL